MGFMLKFALQARWVLPIESPPIERGVVTIEAGQILAVGTRAERGVAVQDLGDVVLMPGLVNAHTHLEFSEFSCPLGSAGMSLPEWIRLVIASRKQTDMGPALKTGIEESLLAGVTTLGEIATSNALSSFEKPLPELIAFQEVIGFSAGRVDSVFSELEQRLFLSRGACSAGISPHAPYTVHPDLLEKLVLLAAQQELPVAMHLAESREELELLAENSGPFRELLEARSMWDEAVFANGLQPFDYLEVLARAPRSLVVHGNYLSVREIDFVAERRDRMSIVYCPRTHAFFGHSPYPLLAMLNAGVRVALGTDSRASNPDLSLLGEMRYVARVHEEISAEQIVLLGTLAGAEALGLGEQLGSLAVGKLANLTAVATDGLVELPYEAVLAGDALPLQTWLRGVPLVGK